ncbi:hypothetical protein Hypma_004435 [Hypsizygus marmoreus]|uniref:Uncharacterized protein n=1 Tax=Hypsizygus marmoreus TaxID=39966 RepID=A0A369K0T3_HYPMA|nr:hypothetical protein Hypma_004435 [Hypsizygus marmoreus]
MRNLPQGSVPETSSDSVRAKKALETITLIWKMYPTKTMYKKMNDLPLLLSYVYVLRWLRASKKIKYKIGGYALKDSIQLPDRSLAIATELAPGIGEVPVFRVTNALTRLCHRQNENLKPGDLTPITDYYLDQDDDVLDPIDLATLLSVAVPEEAMQARHSCLHPHIMYPTHTHEELIVITATIPRETLLAIENGDPLKRKMILEQGKAPIDLKKPLRESELVRMLSAFVDDGVGLADKSPNRRWAEVNSEEDSEEDDE